jgi:hypothetical protein
MYNTRLFADICFIRRISIYLKIILNWRSSCVTFDWGQTWIIWFLYSLNWRHFFTTTIITIFCKMRVSKSRIITTILHKNQSCQSEHLINPVGRIAIVSLLSTQKCKKHNVICPRTQSTNSAENKNRRNTATYKPQIKNIRSASFQRGFSKTR